jgi:hypothetical protein
MRATNDDHHHDNLATWAESGPIYTVHNIGKRFQLFWHFQNMFADFYLTTSGEK